MSKIYNEIVIDMNPESSTFKETLYEDSYEYSGDMMLMGTILTADTGEPIPDEGNFTYYDGKYYKLVDKQGVKSYVVMSDKDVADIKAYNESSEGEGLPEEYQELIDVEEEHPLTGDVDAGATDWGAANITKDMFINPDGTPKSIKEIYTTLDPILTGITGEALAGQIKQILPQFQGVDPKEKEFLGESRELSERGALAQKESNIYGLQPGVGQAVDPYSAAGMGGGMRGDVATKSAISKGLGSAYEGFDIAMDEARLAEEKGIYGLEKTAAAGYESDIAGWIQGMGTSVLEPGETPQVDPTYFGKRGGRVPNRGETFLDFLTQLPDAGGS